MTPRRLFVSRLPSIWGFAISLAVYFSRLLAADEAATPASDYAERFTVSKHGDALIVPMQVGHWKYPCLVDTGASHNAVDLKLQPIVGLTLGTDAATTSGGAVSLPYFTAPDMKLGEIAIDRSLRIFGVDLSPPREVLGFDVQGILGMATLRRHAVRIDFDQGLLDILKPGTKAQENWGEPLPLVADNNGLSFHVRLSLGGAEHNFLLDTGANYVGIDDSLAAELLRRSEIELIQHQRTLTIAGDRLSPIYQLRLLTVGPFNHEEVVVLKSRQNKIGLDYLSRYKVVLDFPNHTMYLKPGAQHDRAEQVSMAGLSIGRKGDKTAVKYVESNSPAERAGLIVDDQLESVGNRPATAYSLFELRKLLGSGHNQQISISYLRSGKRLQATLVLQDPRVAVRRSAASERR